MDLRTLGCRDDGRPLGVRHRIEDFQQGGDPARQLHENPRIFCLKVLLPRKPEIE